MHDTLQDVIITGSHEPFLAIVQCNIYIATLFYLWRHFHGLLSYDIG